MDAYVSARGLVLLSILAIAGCSRSMSYDQQDATRANAINALNEARSAKAEAEQARMQVEELTAKVDRMCGQAPQLCY